MKYHGHDLGKGPLEVEAAVLELSASEFGFDESENDDNDAELLDTSFYDDEKVIILIRAHGRSIELCGLEASHTWMVMLTPYYRH